MIEFPPAPPNRVRVQEVQEDAGKEHCSGIFVKLAEILLMVKYDRHLRERERADREAPASAISGMMSDNG